MLAKTPNPMCNHRMFAATLIACLCVCVFSGCGPPPPREGDVKLACVGNMEVLWAMAYHYKAEHGADSNFVFTPQNLQSYHHGPLPVCPLGERDYGGFTYA